MGKLTRVELENFTVFAELDQTFSPGINVLIGTNGTGKTHLLKVLYAACAITAGEDADKGLSIKLRGIFKPHQGRIGRLIRRRSDKYGAKLVVSQQNGAQLIAHFFLNSANEIAQSDTLSAWQKETLDSTYIPVKEMLAHAPGFLATAARREIAFEDIYTDIIKRAFLPKLIQPVGLMNPELIASLQTILGGGIFLKGDVFFLKNKQGILEFSLLAEGIRKVALLWLLIQNGTLALGSILFWDEPEANLNPSLMGQVVEVLLELQRLGVQIFLATHNYVLLKEFDLRKQPNDAVRYISLYLDESGSAVSHTSDDYNQIHPNAISDTFADLYQRDIARALKGAAES